MSTIEKISSKSSTSKQSSSNPNKQTAPINSLQEQIAVTAYLLAEKRIFAPGYEQQDWFEAERIIQELAT